MTTLVRFFTSTTLLRRLLRWSQTGKYLEYALVGLHEHDVASNPFKQFETWFQEAVAAKIDLPQAMTLATATQDGRPSARTVLLKEFDEQGFVFYTNYNSPKGRELAENPGAALVFYWRELGRQVRITGQVNKIAPEASDRYFQSRPIGSRLAALAASQSEVITDREMLEERCKQLAADYQHREIPRPQSWGGFCLSPETMEFWQGRPNRLHDRLRYTRQPHGGWRIERLAP